MKIVKSIKSEVVGKDNQIKETASLTDIKKLYELQSIRQKARRLKG
jgi:hypothetical protein